MISFHRKMRPVSIKIPTLSASRYLTTIKEDEDSENDNIIKEFRIKTVCVKLTNILTNKHLPFLHENETDEPESIDYLGNYESLKMKPVSVKVQKFLANKYIKTLYNFNNCSTNLETDDESTNLVKNNVSKERVRIKTVFVNIDKCLANKYIQFICDDENVDNIYTDEVKNLPTICATNNEIIDVDDKNINHE